MAGSTKPTYEQRIEALERVVFGSGLAPDQSLPDSAEGEAMTHAICREVCKQAGIPLGWMRIRRRTKALAFYRNVAMHLCLKHTGLSQYQLASLFNRKNHTTILAAKKRISKLMKKSPGVRKFVTSVESEFLQAHSSSDKPDRDTVAFPAATHVPVARGRGTGP